jgi:predicted DNA-binding transcriptional regulator YafY
MILIKQIELLERIHKLIDLSNTGSPKFFARKIGISERRLYEIIDEMKGLDAPIDYSRTSETYYYTEAIEVHISCVFRRLSKNEQQDISAGSRLFSNFFFTACFTQ